MPFDITNLTDRQAMIYLYICWYYAKWGVTPHLIEIRDRFKYRAHSTVTQHLKALARKGLITQKYKQKRSIIVLVFPWDLSMTRKANNSDMPVRDRGVIVRKMTSAERKLYGMDTRRSK